jgi:hypothetical protein
VAFVTTPGENSTDYIGSDNVDVLFVLNDNSGKISVDAKKGNDIVDLTNETGVVGNAEVKLGEGADILTMGANDTGNNRLSGSTVNGGPGNDNITTEGALSTKIRGNENDDDFFLTSNYTNTTLNGNAGVDSFTIGVSATNRGGTIQLSNSKIKGGSDNDGQMDFTDGTILGVDSVIQGGKGLDTISIGTLASGLSNFRVSGGADNDTIAVNNTNGSADGAEYNGADGEDAINFTDTNSGNAVTKGGNGNDRFTFGAANGFTVRGAVITSAAGSGSINAAGEAGDDTFVVNSVTTNTLTAGAAAATAKSGGGKHKLTGGAGSDSYLIENGEAIIVANAGITDVDREKLTIVINSVSESAATTSGTSTKHDSFTGAPIDNSSAAAVAAGGGQNAINAYRGYGDVIDIKSGGTGEELVGNRLNSDEVTNNGALADAASTNYGALKGALDGNLTASVSNVNNTNTGRISLQMVQVFNATTTTLNGYYAILNNTNTILDAGDMMFTMATDSVAANANDAAATAELAQIASAIEAGF